MSFSLNDIRKFNSQYAYSMGACQLLEHQLKLYITEALLLAKQCIGHRMSFNMKGEDYSDASLERLIKIFKQLSNDSKLVADLEKFRERRNYLSHKAIVECLDLNDGEVSSNVIQVLPELADIKDDARKLVMRIHKEFVKITVQRDFAVFDSESSV